MERRLFEVADDSGLLALVDPAGYVSFVDAAWTFEQVVRHFKEEMKNRRLVIWGTGREDTWRVEVRFRRSSDTGFREFTVLVWASGEHLLLTNYESLTMAAQFEDVKLPEAHQRDLLIPVASGLYQCRIVQRFDPEPSDPPVRDNNADFVIELIPAMETARDKADVSVIPWTGF